MPSSVPDRELEIVAQVEAVPIDIDLSDFIIGFPTQAGSCKVKFLFIYFLCCGTDAVWEVL